MDHQAFELIYRQFRLEFYKNYFRITKEKQGSLAATEMSAAEVIFLLKRPTIKEFADFIEISQPNATYKIKALIEKGYIQKLASSSGDKREFCLDVTDKFRQYYQEENTYGYFLLKQMQASLNEEEIKQVEAVIHLLNNRLHFTKE